MTKLNQCYGIGQALINVLPPPIPFENAPTSSQTNYAVGQIVFTPGPVAQFFYIYAGGGVWSLLDNTSGDILSVTTDDNTVVLPVAGNVNLKGNGSTTTVGSGANATVELTGLTNHNVLVGAGTTTITKVAPSATSGVPLISQGAAADPVFGTAVVAGGGTGAVTFTAHGVLIGEGTSAVVATAAGTAGQVLTSGGASADPVWTTATFPSTATAGALIAATATNVIGQIADVAVGQLLASGGVGVIPAYTASPSVTGNMTAATGFVATTAGAGITLNSPAASGAASGPVVVNGRSGQATFTTVSIAAAADLTLTITNSSITGSTTQVIYSMSGATTGAALSIKSVTNTAGSSAIVVTNGTGATTTTADIVINFIVIN